MLTDQDIELIREYRRKLDEMKHTQELRYSPKDLRPVMETRELVVKFYHDLMHPVYRGRKIPTTRTFFSVSLYALNPDALDKARKATTTRQKARKLFFEVLRGMKGNWMAGPADFGLCDDKVCWFRKDFEDIIATHVQILEKCPEILPGATPQYLGSIQKWFCRTLQPVVRDQDGAVVEYAPEIDPFPHEIMSREVSWITKFRYALYKLGQFLEKVPRVKEEAFQHALPVLDAYERVYWRGNTERKYNEHILFRHPEYIGTSLRAVYQINWASSYGLNPDLVYRLANVFGLAWNQYAARKTQDKAVKRLLHKVSSLQIDFESVGKSSNRLAYDADLREHLGSKELVELVAQAIHDAALAVPVISHREAKGLREYLWRYDWRRNQPYVHICSMVWASLSESERKMTPQDAIQSFSERLNSKIQSFHQIPEKLAQEIIWLVPTLCEDITESEALWELFSKTVIAAQDVYEAGLQTPLPSWAKGEVEHKGFTCRWLSRDDARGLFIGHYTNCCQYFGCSGGAEECAIHAQSSPFGANLVIEHRGKIIGCAWVWEGTDGQIYFDSIETQYTYSKNPDILVLVQHMIGEMGLDGVYLGARFSDVDLSAFKIEEVESLPLPSDYPVDGYSDCKKRVWLPACSFPMLVKKFSCAV